MSVSCSSWESILALTNYFYTSDLQLFYTHNHLTLICDILGHLSNKRSFLVITTQVPLLEPIIYNANQVLISIPLVAKLINRHIYLPDKQITVIQQNIFENLMSCVGDPSMQERERRYQDFRLCVGEQAELAEYSTKDTTIRFIQTLRMVLMCAHYIQHVEQKIPFNTHHNYQFIEHAVDLPTKLLAQHFSGPFDDGGDNKPSTSCKTLVKKKKKNKLKKQQLLQMFKSN
jgi:hypothetical protein